MNDHDRFLKDAKAAVIETWPVTTELDHIWVHDLYIVWFAKTLQNWKALISTDAFSGIYWEVTHNGDKGETYVDTYRKEFNRVVRP